MCHVEHRHDGVVAKQRGELLAAAIDYAARVGLDGFSLRACAAAIGTSHRMLGYHFGTRDELVSTIIDTVSAQQRAVLDAFVATRPTDTPVTSADIEAAFQQLLADEGQLRLVALLGEAVYRVARHPGRYSGAAPTYEAIVQLWTPHLEALFGLGVLPVDQRVARIRLAVAVLVGLSVDYLGTRDARAYVGAYREWVRLNLGR